MIFLVFHDTSYNLFIILLIKNFPRDIDYYLLRKNLKLIWEYSFIQIFQFIFMMHTAKKFA